MKSLEKHQPPKIWGIHDIARVAGCVVSAGAAVTVGGVVTVSTSGCGDNEAEELTAPAAQELANAESFAPENLTPAQMADIYTNLTPEQQAALGTDYTPEQLMAAVQQTPPQINPEDTTLGLINMEDIQESIEQASDISDLEQRVNQVYEGDHVVLMRVRNEGGETITEGWEDLDDTGVISDNSDDMLFSFTLDNDTHQAELRGHGVNSYHAQTYPPSYTPPGAFWTGYLLATTSRPRFVYVTPRARRPALVNHIQQYRTTPAWQAQRRANRQFYVQVRQHNPRWPRARVRVTPVRASFRAARRGHGRFRPGAPRPPSVHVNAPTPPRPPRPPSVHVTAPAPPRPPRPPSVHINAPTPPRPPSVHIHGPRPPRPPSVTIHGGGR